MTNTDIQAAYVGSSEAVRMYLGTNIVWEKESPVPPGPTPSGYTDMPLTIEALEPGVVKFGKGQFGSAFTVHVAYAVNDDTEYTEISQSDLDDNTFEINVNIGDKVHFMGFGNTQFSKNNSTQSYTFSGTTCRCNIYGNIMSMLDGYNYPSMVAIPYGTTGLYTFYSFFRSVPVVDASNLILPAMTLSRNCYTSMFYGCAQLLTGPVLPATDLRKSSNQGCYSSMFRQCSHIEKVVCLAEQVGSTGLQGQIFNNWLAETNSTGTLYQSPNTAITWVRGGSQVPNGWTIVNYVPNN